MKVVVRVLYLVGLLVGIAFAQHSGDHPPGLVWDKLKGDCPANLDWASMRGEVVVITFASDPIFPDDLAERNKLRRSFQDKPVVFIHVVTGSEFLLDQALKTAGNIGCIIFDGSQRNRESFQLSHSLPRTVVVDELGLVAGYSRDNPNEDAIRAVLDHKTETGLSEVPLKPQPYDEAPGTGPPPSFKVRISPAPGAGLGRLGLLGPDRYIAEKQPLKYIIGDLWNTPLARTLFPEGMDEGKYSIDAHVPVPDRDVLLSVVREAVATHFGLRIERETRIERVYLLTAGESLSSQLQLADKKDVPMTGNSVDGTILGTAQTMQEIAGRFEVWLHAPVIDETGMTGKFNYSVSSDRPDPEASLDIARQLGLKLEPADRPVEVLVVQKME
jgi:uncharacterized protein (TIGR03435 family)